MPTHARAHTLCLSQTNIRQTCGQFSGLLLTGRRTETKVWKWSSVLHVPTEVGNQNTVWWGGKNPVGLDSTPRSAPGLLGDLRCHFPHL